MATHVSSKEFVLNGTLVLVSCPRTGAEREELNLISYRISQNLKRHTTIFDAIVTNRTITVVVAPGIDDDEDIEWTVADAIETSRSNGASLCGADPSLGVFKNIRSGVLKYEKQQEANLYYIVLVTAHKLLQRSYETSPKRRRPRLIAQNAGRVAKMIGTILHGRTGS